MTRTKNLQKDATTRENADWCLEQLEHYEQGIVSDPLTNSVNRLGYRLFQAGQRQEIDTSRLIDMAKMLSDDALVRRADDLAMQHQDGPITQVQIDAMMAPLANQDFARIKKDVERTRTGIVFTAHPTFAMSTRLRKAVANYASAAKPAQRKSALDAMIAQRHAPDGTITLDDEHTASRHVIDHASRAINDITVKIFDWARRHYPAQWSTLNPVPISLATWVGYDLDGRTDIHWGETFRIRLAEKAQALGHYADGLAGIALKEHQSERDDIVTRLRNAAQFTAHQAEQFSGDLDDPQVVTRAANTLTEDHPDRLTGLASVLLALNDLIAGIGTDQQSCLALCALRAQMQALGLGTARIHLRINAAQVISALRADLGLEHGRSFTERTILDAAAEKSKTVSRRNINVASIFLEPMTARRQMMLCAEFFKHIDADTPIRFLIAECEAPATVMGAIYLARLYGVEDLLDISPLFETPYAMERGGRLIERLLEEDEFVQYIRARGRIAIQIGFSDSGRFMGQIAANCAIERLQILLARALASKGIRDVEVVVFNTHGESMGRGAYPGTLNERFDYLMTPWTRARFHHEAIALNAEASFQGGDGFLHFETEHLAGATTKAMLQWGFAQPKADKSDQFYADINYSWDFYRSIKAWQETLFEDVDYQISVGAFAANLLFTTGSRKARRQSGASITGPKSLRAIPHNAILQQLAVPVNVFGGVGLAAGLEAERFIEQVQNSSRMRALMGMVRRSRSLASLPVVRAYGTVFDASFWISKAFGETDPNMVFACEQLALHLKDLKIPTAISRFSNHIAADLARLDKVFLVLDGEQYYEERHDQRRTVHALHAIRLAMIMRAFMLTASVPSFSQRHDCTRSTLLDLACALQFDDLADMLDDIFPLNDAGAAQLRDIKEPSDDDDHALRGYPQIHTEVIEPLRRIHCTIREIGVGIAHHYGAYG